MNEKPQSFLPPTIETAPKDGTIVRLLVQFSHDDNAFSFEDSDEPCWTIGFNNFGNTQEDYWQVVGWNWEQDTFQEAKKFEIIGWLPMIPEITNE